MTGFIDLVVSFYRSIFGLFNATVIELSGHNVSLGAVLFVCIAFYMIISIYWRGAKG